MFDARKAAQLLMDHMNNITHEQLTEEIKKFCPYLLEDDFFDGSDENDDPCSTMPIDRCASENGIPVNPSGRTHKEAE